MLKRKGTVAAVIVSAFFVFSSFNTAYAASLKEGMKGSSVTELQSKLKKLGYFNAQPTGYYGSLTEASVKKFQSQHRLTVDGKAGDNTISVINKVLAGNKATATRKTAASKADTSYKGLLTPWFKGAENVFTRGAVAKVYDIATGLSFNARRTYGYNHADCEPLTAKDTQIMKKIYGGDWSWSRRAVIVTVGGKKLAASMAGMPHAGLENVKANRYVTSRSGGYGRGVNLDAVKNNSMSGHFDIHFLRSRTHGTNRVDPKHQAAVKKAAQWAQKSR